MTITITVPLFGGEVLICKSRREWNEAGAAFNFEQATAESAGLALSVRASGGRRLYIVGVFDRCISTLAHELAHATFFILGDAGVPTPIGDANETFSYLLGQLMSEALPATRFCRN